MIFAADSNDLLIVWIDSIVNSSLPFFVRIFEQNDEELRSCDGFLEFKFFFEFFLLS